LSKEVIAPSTPAEKEAPHLRRVLGRWDLVLLFCRRGPDAVFVGLAAFFFFVYGRRKAARVNLEDTPIGWY